MTVILNFGQLRQARIMQYQTPTVDHLGWFLYVAVATPGSQPYVNAFNQTSIHSLLKDLPLGYFLLGDNASKPSEYLAPIFGGANQINNWLSRVTG
jgi:hypothetical protein